MEAPIARLEEMRGELAKTWLMRAIEQAPLSEIERLPVPRIARELPEMIADIARAARDDDAVSPEAGPRHVEWAKRLAELTGREGAIGPQLIRDLASLQSVMLTALHRQVRTLDPVATLQAVERLAEIFSSMQAAAVEELLRQRSRELEWLGTTDSLTGLHNERFLRQHMTHLLAMQKRFGHPFALLLIDIDGLKRINDAYGSAAGDRTLLDVATILGESVRAVDTPIRVRDDEFCVLLPNQTAARATVLAERIAAGVEAVEGPSSQTLSVAIGVVSSPQHSTECEELLELADAAMFEAKAAGERVKVSGGESEPSAEGANGNSA